MHLASHTKRTALARTALALSAWLFVAGGCSQGDEPAADHPGAAATEGAAHADESTTKAAEPAGSATESAGSASEGLALHKSDPTGTYGAGIKLENEVAIATLTAAPETYVDRILKVRGTVTEVCPKRGCWIELADAGGETLRVKVTDGEIVFPLSAKGHEAVVEGIFERIELDEAQHRAWKEHEAEERGVDFDPEDVGGPGTIWRLQGLGARIDS